MDPEEDVVLFAWVLIFFYKTFSTNLSFSFFPFQNLVISKEIKKKLIFYT